MCISLFIRKLVFAVIVIVLTNNVANAQLISSIAGTGVGSSTGDGLQATAATLNNPSGVFRDLLGNIYVVEYSGNRVRKIAPTGIISTFAGNGIAGYSGDGGPATNASFHVPIDITFDNLGNAYIVDNVNSAIRKVDVSGIITTFAGNHTNGYTGDGGMATNASLYWPDRVGHDNYGNIYIADAQNNVIRKVTIEGGIITTVAGTGTAGFSGDGGQATAAMLNWTLGVAFDGNDNMYIADGNNYRIRKVTPAGIISTFAGNGTYGIGGDGGPATNASFQLPAGLAIDGGCNVYVSDWHGQNVRKIFTSGIIETVVGNGTAGFSGDGGFATLAQIDGPDNITFDTSYSVYIADYYNNRVRKVVKLGANTGCPFTYSQDILDARQGYNIYPNPSTGTVYFSQISGANEAVTVKVINSIGTTVYNNTVDLINGKYQLDLSQNNPGIYFIELIDNQGSLQTSKIQIEK